MVIPFLQVVIFRDGTYLTLKEVFESLDLSGYENLLNSAIGRISFSFPILCDHDHDHGDHLVLCLSV